MNVVEEALTEYQIPNSWWPIPLLNTLQRVDISLCIPWVASSILEYLASQPHDYATEMTDGIRRAVAATSAIEIHGLLSEYDTYLHPVRDNVLLGYRNLLLGKMFLLEGDVISFRTRIIWALIDLGDCEFSRLTHIQFVVNNFLRLMPVPVHAENGILAAER